MAKMTLGTRLFGAVLMWLAFSCSAGAQTNSSDAKTSNGELRVITRVISPFVLKEGDSYKGFSVELWAAIAKELDVPFHFVEKNNIKEILASMAASEGDVAIAAISITAEREQKLDFFTADV